MSHANILLTYTVKGTAATSSSSKLSEKILINNERLEQFFFFERPCHHFWHVNSWLFPL